MIELSFVRGKDGESDNHGSFPGFPIPPAVSHIFPLSTHMIEPGMMPSLLKRT